MIRVDSISKQYKLYRAPSDRLKEIVFKKKCHTDFQALKDVSFEVEDGETLGIIGQNGAGKSTLLKIMMGITLSDSGDVHISGKITGLLELGTGFNHEMTGIQNILMNGTLIGMSREEIEEKKQDIIDFTELGEFIHEPIKMYSSGMVMRLAFSIAIFAEPKCFLVDEALSVGDAHFQQKCMTRLKEFRAKGGSIVFVSHDMNAIKMLCDKAILLDHGVVVDAGDPENVVNQYNFLISKINDTEEKMLVEKEEKHSYGTFEAKITEVSLVGKNSKSNVISSGEDATITVEIEATKDMDDLNVGILIRDKYGQDVFGTNLFHYDQLLNVKEKGRYVIDFQMQMNIGIGKYTITTAITKGMHHLDHCLHWKDGAKEFEVAGQLGNISIGICKLHPTIAAREVS